uniref:Probable protein phosphatase DDB_G0279461 n=1 Tax=Dermatophagoides pteronyssinus TaxID=6956 RepID=A0A6P6Y7Z5_DERPT|nr:probable protein phosphatase DDB_G0279461 [Dermatophagoides pteronyssinus]
MIFNESTSTTTTMITESIIQMNVQNENNDQDIVCRAENILLNHNNNNNNKQRKRKQNSYIENKYRLDIIFAPKVTLQQLYDDQQNDQINNSTMKIINNGGGGGYAIRGQQLQLYCNISANPLVLATDIHWYKDSILINDNHNMNISNSDGTATTTTTRTTSGSNIDNAGGAGGGGGGGYIKFTHNGTRLLITKVTDEWQGFYQCIAQNQMGTGFSNQFQVQILYEPNCVTPTQTIPANIGSIVTMICEIDANPITNVTFLWRTKHQEILFPSLSSSTSYYNHHHHNEQQQQQKT